MAIILNYEVPKRPIMGQHFTRFPTVLEEHYGTQVGLSSPSLTNLARKGTTTTHNTHMHISINTLIAIAAALDFASFIGIIVLIAR